MNDKVCLRVDRPFFAALASAGMAQPMNVELVDAEASDIAAATSGDEAAYARLIQRHQAEITKWMWRFTRDRRELEELVHDVFVEAYFSLKSYRHSGPWLHWLKKIATRVGYKFWKRAGQRRETRELTSDQWQELSAASDHPAPSSETSELLHQALAQLPPRDRLVLTLMYLEELPTERVAELTGWSRVMVKVQAFRARGKLKKLLDKYEF